MPGKHSGKRAAGTSPSSWIREKKRLAIYARDGWACVWCGEIPDILTLDHLFPRASRFRDNDPTRLVTACFTCNVSRRQLSVAAFLRKIRLSGFDVAAVVARLSRRHWPLVYGVDTSVRPLRQSAVDPSLDGWVEGGWLGPVLFVNGIPY